LNDKDAYWFSHDSNASNDPDIIYMRSEYGWHGYGLYWAIVERLRDIAGYKYPLSRVHALAFDLHEENIEEFVLACIKKYTLFESDGAYFWSPSLIRRMAKREENKELRAEQARKAAAKRWGNEENGDNAAAMPQQCPSNADACAPAMHEECKVMPLIRQDNIRQDKTLEEERAREKWTNSRWPEDSLELSTWFAFEKGYGSFLPDIDKERNAVDQILHKARERGDPEPIIKGMMQKLLELKKTDDSKKGFWKRQPFLPSTLVSLWTRVWEEAKIDAEDQSDAEDITF